MTDLPAGPALDVLIATKVMGWTRLPDSFDGIVATPVYRTNDGFETSYVPPFSTMIVHAWEVVERMSRPPHSLCVQIENDSMQGEVDEWSCHFNPVGMQPRGYAVADTAPLAICRAALRATATG